MYLNRVFFMTLDVSLFTLPLVYFLFEVGKCRLCRLLNLMLELRPWTMRSDIVKFLTLVTIKPCTNTKLYEEM